VIVGDATATVAASTHEVVEFVLDLERYREADHKVRRVGAIHRDGDTGTAQFSSRLMGLPGPRGVYPFRVTPTGLWLGSPIGGAARWFLDMEVTFDCLPTDEGLTVHHREAFTFKRPWRWLEPVFRRWLERDTAAEMVRFKRIIDA
jgi:hypothetical protein